MTDSASGKAQISAARSATVMPQRIETTCCIAGGGPAGMMVGFLLARMGVDVYVLEKHGDFLRDFRGDTIHPSTLEVMHELGLLKELLKRPHQEVRNLVAEVGRESVTIGDFTRLPTHCKFLVFMPQWDFLDFLAEQSQRYPAFHLKMRAEVTDLIQENRRVSGVRARTPEGTLEIRARLTIGADGRHSVVRERAGLEVTNVGAPMDVLCMQISRRADDPGQTFGHVDSGRFFIAINRDEYWQCGLVIPKGSFDEMRARGLPALREEIAKLSPYLRDRIGELRDWKDISLLTVTVDRLTRWFLPGLLCIGDAAHAMSPVGGVGINLAIQDAVAAANMLGVKLMRGGPTEEDLRAFEKRRIFPTRATQRLQVAIQNRVIRRVLAASKPLTLPWPLKLLKRWPYLRRFPARLIGMGFRPEHVKTSETKTA